MVHIKNVRISFLFCHNFEELMFNISLDKIFQNVKVMLHNNDVSILQGDFIDFIGQWSHMVDFIDFQSKIFFLLFLMLLFLLFLRYRKRYLVDLCKECWDFLSEERLFFKSLIENKLSPFLIIGFCCHKK